VPEAPREPAPRWVDRLPRVDRARFHRLAQVSLVLVVLIVVTGAAVRLTGSGLGCPDWPSCYQHRLTAQLSEHPLVEFSNRLVTVVLTVVLAVTFLASLLRRRFRRDLAWLSGGLVGGVLVQAVLGGIVVYTKLNPYLVLVHFCFTMVLVADAVVLVHRSTRDYRPGTQRLLAPRLLLRFADGVLCLLGVVIVAGSATSGAGPHAGNSQGQLVAKRLPVQLRTMAELHSSLALLLIGAVVGLVVALHVVDVPERVRRSGRILMIMLMVQAAIGYTQYFTHLPALLVELHVIGATVLVVGTVQFVLALAHHPPEHDDATEPAVAEEAPDVAVASR
jgi:cytochrome c oxidase assembly protein subunit 15